VKKIAEMSDLMIAYQSQIKDEQVKSQLQFQEITILSNEIISLKGSSESFRRKCEEVINQENKRKYSEMAEIVDKFQTEKIQILRKCELDVAEMKEMNGKQTEELNNRLR
jgi:hypothetical protein